MKINASNSDKINAAITAAEGRATARTMDHGDVSDAIKRAENTVALSLLPKASHVGARVTYRPAHKLPASYNYRADATAITIERFASGWFLVNAYRAPVNESYCNEISLSLPEFVAELAKAAFVNTFSVPSQK